jgi:hypothetical protein
MDTPLLLSTVILPVDTIWSATIVVHLSTITAMCYCSTIMRMCLYSSRQ